MTFKSTTACRTIRRKLLPVSLIAALAMQAAATLPPQTIRPQAQNFASTAYPLHPVMVAPPIARSDDSPHWDTVSPGKPLATCDEAGLRAAIAGASSGDVLDLTACSHITVTAGDIFVNVNDLTLNGPGADQLTIDGGPSRNYYGRIFRHTRFGRLSINNMTLANAGYASLYSGANIRGGCIYSSGSVALTNAVVTGCQVASFVAFGGDYAIGGAIYAREDLTLNNSAIVSSQAYSASNQAEGGGVFVRHNFSATDSSIANNIVFAPASQAIGGGVVVLGTGDVAIVRSTLSGNEAAYSGGASVNTTGNIDVINSTISSNYAALIAGGGVFVPAATFTNSTITQNVAGVGVGVYGYQLTLESTIVADNLDSSGLPTTDVYAGAIGGGNNLVVNASSPMSADTIRACPRLKPLSDNGGPTLTQKPIAGSPVVEWGSNTIPLDTDQRSTGFPRTYSVRTDIGSVEWQGELDDEIFKSAFEARCDEY